MDVSGVSASIPPAQQTAVQAPIDETPAPPAEPLPPDAIPPQGMQGRPPIENIANNPANPMASPMAVGEPSPGGMAEIQAASQAVAEDIVEEQQEEEQIAEAEESSASESPDIGTDESMVVDMKNALKRQTDEVSRKVTRSAFKYAYKNKNWINKDSAPEAEAFFTVKVPQVLSDELSKILNDALGLSEPTPT